MILCPEIPPATDQIPPATASMLLLCSRTQSLKMPSFLCGGDFEYFFFHFQIEHKPAWIMLNGSIGSGMMNGTKVQPHFEILPESPQLPRRSPSLNRAGGADDLHGDDCVEDGGGERTPFLPPVTLSPGQAPRKAQDQAAWHLLEGHQPPRASSQFRARIENTLAFMLRHGCGRQLLMLAIVFLTFWLVIFVFVLPVMDAKDLARLKVSCCVSLRICRKLTQRSLSPGAIRHAQNHQDLSTDSSSCFCHTWFFIHSLIPNIHTRS